MYLLPQFLKIEKKKFVEFCVLPHNLFLRFMFIFRGFSVIDTGRDTDMKHRLAGGGGPSSPAAAPLPCAHRVNFRGMQVPVWKAQT